MSFMIPEKKTKPGRSVSKYKIRVAIADDHLIILEGLTALFRVNSKFELVYTTTNGQALLSRNKELKVDVLILDLDLPVISGHEAFEVLRKESPELKIVILSGSYEKKLIIDYYKKGAAAFLPKGCDTEQLFKAIEEVYEHGRYLQRDVADMLIEAAWGSEPEEQVNFTERELQIIRLICEDKSSKEIAGALLLNVRTVEHDRSVILGKIKAKSVSAIIKYAIKYKLVDL